jgi:hypothetical protein
MNAPPPAIDFVRYSGRRGGIWLKDAATMLVAQRIPWLVLVGVYYLIQLLVSAIPVAGPLVLMVLAFSEFLLLPRPSPADIESFVAVEALDVSDLEGTLGYRGSTDRGAHLFELRS